MVGSPSPRPVAGLRSVFRESSRPAPTVFCAN
ncbi:MAG: hypothetical protein FD124_3658, partial [Alphaproteobacteria bacterium]